MKSTVSYPIIGFFLMYYALFRPLPPQFDNIVVFITVATTNNRVGDGSKMVRVDRNNKSYGSYGPRTPSQPDESMLESCCALSAEFI